MGDMKGSSSNKEQKIEAEPVQDYSAMYNAMNQMAAMNAALNAQAMTAMTSMQAAAPKVQAEPDWKARADSLREKIASSVTADNAARRGRESTILTSPLTDEKVKTTESVLTGS